MKISIKHNCVIAFALFVGLQATSSATSFDPLLKSKIDPVVIKKAEAGNLQDFVVVLKEQADISGAYRLNTKEEKGEYVYKTLTETANRTQREVISLLDESGVTYQRFWVINAFVVNGDAALASRLAALNSVAKIIENSTYTYVKPLPAESTGNRAPGAAEWGIIKTKADQVWALGYKGQGVVVGGQDTGYEWGHAAIKNQYRGWNGTTADHNYNWHDAVHSGAVKCGNNSKAPCDDQQHGTHTMGTMVGDDGGANKIGMAPGAKWIGCRDMNNGVGTFESYVEAFQWLLAPTDLNDANADPRKAPHVINNSWGCPTTEGCNSGNFATMEAVVKNLRAAGIVVVVSAGNDGSACSTINTPAAIFEGSFTVGSTTNGDAISSFSSRGPVTVYGSRLSPDISAPGSDVRSCIPGGGYTTMSGTSMAGPHVAGLVALVISANPNLAGKVDIIENLIQSTAVKLTSSQTCGGVSGSTIPNNTFGNGRIDALAAVKKAVSLSVDDLDVTRVSAKAYPNPFTNKVTFELKNWNNAATIQLYSLTGQQILSEQWNAAKAVQDIDLSSLPAGIYFYKISNEKQHVQGKLVKTNF